MFDLFDTLVDYDETTSREFSGSAARLLGRDHDEFHATWRAGRPDRETGPLVAYLEALGLDEKSVAALAELRKESSRRLLGTPRPGAVETLVELRSRGIGTGLITVCSDDVPAVWSGTPFAGLFDAEVFSCSVGLRKPDARIYRIACDQLGVRAEHALFVGDGANDELDGAERAGMRAVLIHRDGEDPPWPEVRDWPGPRITALPQVLELL
ncbi:MAG TPA: HAD family hydrolase [Gaiellaceae bacterium]|nr:HAD family hydrolase [Gaiellaceae bacterium]